VRVSRWLGKNKTHTNLRMPLVGVAGAIIVVWFVAEQLGLADAIVARFNGCSCASPVDGVAGEVPVRDRVLQDGPSSALVGNFKPFPFLDGLAI
jgi:hypothetical protein